MASVVTVVKSESLTDRQRMRRWASANPSVSSNISLTKTTLNQASGGKLPDHAAVFTGGKKRIDQHDQQRPGCRKKENHQRRRAQQPAPAGTSSLRIRLQIGRPCFVLQNQSLNTCTEFGLKTTLTDCPTLNFSVSSRWFWLRVTNDGIVRQADMVMGIRPEIHDVFQYSL